MVDRAGRPRAFRLEIVVPLAILGLMAVGLVAGGVVVVVFDQRVQTRFETTTGTVISSSVDETNRGRHPLE